jgi:hypothetical protein
VLTPLVKVLLFTFYFLLFQAFHKTIYIFLSVVSFCVVFHEIYNRHNNRSNSNPATATIATRKCYEQKYQ